MEEVKFERVVRIPSMIIGVSTGDRILAFLNEAGREKQCAEGEAHLRQMFQRKTDVALSIDPKAVTEDLFAISQAKNHDLLSALGVDTFTKYTFLSDTQNLVFESTDFKIADLPKNIHRIYARADGLNKFIEVKLKLRFKNFSDVDGWLETQIVVQGSDLDWVNATAKTLEDLLATERLMLRGLVYQNARVCFWSSLVLALGIEFSSFHYLHPKFDFNAPLSGLAVIALFAVLSVTTLGLGNIIIGSYTYLFPYCEIEGNFSRRRTSAQQIARAVLSSLVIGGIINAIHLLLAPIWKW